MALLSSKDLLLLFVVSNALMHLGSSVTLYDWTIQITNGSRKTPLVMQCLSNNKGIGSREIEPLGRQAFLSHVLVKQRSWVTCEMRLGELRGRFDLFDSKRGDLKRCRDKACLWTVDESGLFLAIGPELVIQYRWAQRKYLLKFNF